MEEGCSENGNSVLKGKKGSPGKKRKEEQKGAEERACSEQEKNPPLNLFMVPVIEEIIWQLAHPQKK